MRERPVLDKQPEWDIRFEGWARKYIKKNRWRCDSTEDEDDLLQEAYLIFRRVLATYPLITEPSHIMALFQAAVVNEYKDKSKEWTKRRKAEVSLEQIVYNGEGTDFTILDTLGENSNEGMLRLIIAELPKEVQQAISALNSAEKMALLRQPPQQSRMAILAGFPEQKESLNDALCRIIGLRKPADLVGMIKSALTPLVEGTEHE